MATIEKPKARQSQLVTTYGVGSLFPAGDQSFMICGIDEWDEGWCAEIAEPRLARSLAVNTFRAPATGKKSGDVPAVRFPAYHYCPKCRRLDYFWKFDAKKMQCADCSLDLTPSRFVACCENGHIEEFPYFQWVHRGSDAVGGTHRMQLTTRGASSSLADIVISCSCEVAPHDMDGSFSAGALRQIKSCGGKRPWLIGADDESCEKPLRVLQRGSSNVWFAAVRSSISIPPWSSPAARFVTKNWGVLEHIPDVALEAVVDSAIKAQKAPGLTAADVLGVVARRKGLDPDHVPTDAELRAEEYQALVTGNEKGAHDNFECRTVDVDAALRGQVVQVAKATRLREVRALEGFTRVSSMPTEQTAPRTARLSLQHRDWLPATEVLGEGIFMRLDEGLVARWEGTPEAGRRQSELARSVERRAAESGVAAPEPPTARFLAIHSLAHALLQELSLDAGYPVSSLRERVYAEEGQAGILIYTASSDAAGSLGGLAALAEPGRFAHAFTAAVSRAGWCSNDPVCSESGPSGSDGLNLAACHACLLLPETSCEHRNVYLDRVTLVGTIEDDSTGLVAGLAP
ncbi:MAG: DrmB family protein [Cellulomonas sp.]